MCDRLWGLICVRRARRDTISGGGRMPRCSDGSRPGYPTTWQETTSPGILPKSQAGGQYPTQYRGGQETLLRVSSKVLVTLWKETLHELRQNVE